METKQQTKKNNLLAGLVIVIIMVCGGFILHSYLNRYDHYKTANDAQQAANQIQGNALDDKFNILMVYQTGCPDCAKVHNKIINTIKHNRNNPNYNFTMVDTHESNIRQYVLAHDILNTPTVVVLYHGKVVEQYSGDNITRLNRALTARNILTGDKLPVKEQLTAHIVNDFSSKINKKYAIANYPKLNYLK